MAYFERRKNGWMAQVRRRGMATLSRTFDRKADADAWAREIERELQQGNMAALDTMAQRTTVTEVTARFRASMAELYKQSNRAPVESRLKTIEARWGDSFLASIRPVDLAKWRDDMLDQGLSGQSVRHCLNLLSRVLRFAEQELGIALPANNPAKIVRKPSVAKARDRRLRDGEMDYLLRAAAAARGSGLAEILILAKETSMRLGELLSLEWRLVDQQKRTVHLEDTKNAQSRTVALSTHAMDALNRLPRRIDGRVFSWKPGHENGSFEKVSQRCLARARRHYADDCAKQGTDPETAFLDDLRFHDLRHEATSCLFEKGLGIMEVASMTGHKSLSMLQRYTHMDAAKLAQKLG